MKGREEELFLKDYLKIVLKRKWTILMTLAFFIVVTFVINYFSKPVYKAKTTILIFPWGVQQSIFSGIGSSSIFGGADEIETHIQMIKSYSVAQGVAEKLHSSIFVTAQGDKNLSAKNNTRWPFSFLNKILLKFTKQHNREDIDASNYDNGNGEEFHINNNIVNKIRNSITVNSIKNTNMIEINCETFSAEISAEIANITADVFIEKTLVVNRSNISKVKIFIEEQLAEKEKELIALEGELQHIRNNEKLEDREIRQANLERMVRVSENIYILLLEKYQEAKVNEVMEFGGITIIDKALIPDEPVKPKKVSNLFVGGIIGLIFGVALTFFLELTDHTVSNTKDIERILELPVLGVIPKGPSKKR